MPAMQATGAITVDGDGTREGRPWTVRLIGKEKFPASRGRNDRGRQDRYWSGVSATAAADVPRKTRSWITDTACPTGVW